MDDILQSSYYDSLLVSQKVVWFVDELEKLGSELNFYFLNNKKDIIMTQEDEEYIKKTFVGFVKKVLSMIMSHRRKLNSFRLYFIILVTLIVICSSRVWLI